MKFKLSVIISILMILISCSEENTANQAIENQAIETDKSTSLSPPTGNLDISKKYKAHFQTEIGEFEVELFDDLAPYTVENFVNLSNAGYYNDTTFHRVLPDFMAQGGDPTATGMGGPGYKFADEFHVDLRHDSEGILSMANSGINSNGSQFFITFGPLQQLDAFDPYDNTLKNCINMTVSCHAVFGKVVNGMEIVKSIRLRDPGTDTKPGTKIRNIIISVE